MDTLNLAVYYKIISIMENKMFVPAQNLYIFTVFFKYFNQSWFENSQIWGLTQVFLPYGKTIVFPLYWINNVSLVNTQIRTSHSIVQK